MGKMEVIMNLLNNGNFYINILPTFIPLFFWSILIYRYYYPFLMKKSDLTKVYLVPILLIPYVITLYTSITHLDEFADSKIFMPFDVPPACLTTYPAYPNNNGIFGLWNYKCGLNQVKHMGAVGADIGKRLYYINYGIFLLMLIYDKYMTSKNKQFTTVDIKFLLIPLLLGTIGSLAPLFTTFYIFSHITLQIFMGILNMNIAAFLFAIITLID